MQEVAIVYGVIAWLACWMIDLIVTVIRGPIFIDPILKLVIVAACLIVILMRLTRAGWLIH